VFDSVSLQCAEIVGVAKLGAELLEDLPVAPFAFLAECADEVTAEIIDHRVVVEQGVVDVEQEHRVCHRPLP